MNIEPQPSLPDNADAEKRLQADLPVITFPDELPVVEHRHQIATAIRENQVIVVSGDTGSGKTTQIPKICLDMGLGTKAMIGCTQPRRIAALTVASRVAEELGCAPGALVGHHIRFDQKVTRQTRIKYMTDGILLAETTKDRDLRAYDTLMIDEAHERSLNIDFLLGYIKQLLPRRPDLKVIVSSATLDIERFAQYFSKAPVVEVPGKTYPVEVLYRVPEEEDAPVPESVVSAVEEVTAQDPKGSILVFLTGERDIRETTDLLKGRQLPHTDVLPLMARLPAAQQRRVFQTTSQRRIVLATNVAETSVTIPGIRYVIDSGLARVNRYHHHTQIQRLHIEAVSQASANQRKGRCGRTGPGICFRLYSEEDYLQREEFTTPEIKRTSLAGVILNMMTLKLGDIETFPFIEPPAPNMIREGYRELIEIGALDGERRLTALGKQIARFPLEPRFARMLLEAEKEQALVEALIIVAALESDDPRLRPLDKKDEADRLHAQYLDEKSDFIALLNLWNHFQEQSKRLRSQSKIRRYCTKQLLSFRRMREWRDIHEQLKDIAKDLKLRVNKRPASPDAIHRALLSGLLSRIGNVQQNREYLGARNIRFHIFPGSGLFKRAPKWVMAGEMVDTTRLYARCVAQLDPKWIEPLAKHLCKFHYGQPFWDERSGFVRAEERVTLYGLTIAQGRNKHYGPIDPAASREVFIREGLVPGAFPPPRPSFLKQNLKLIESVRALEHKQRRSDLLAGEEQLQDFYDERLPHDLFSAVGLKRWLQRVGPDATNLLLMKHDDVLLKKPDEDLNNRFPDSIKLDGTKLTLSYLFEGGHDADGITCTAPVSMQPALSRWGSEWLVPGALPEKVEYLLRHLPKSIRRQLVPIPDTVKRCLAVMTPYQKPLREALSESLKKVSGVQVPQAEWVREFPPHLTMNFRLVDNKGQPVAQGRNAKVLTKQLSGAKKERTGPAVEPDQPKSNLERNGLTRWNFGDLPEKVEVGEAGWNIHNYPALVDRETSVAIKLFSDPREAQRQHRLGLRRLFGLQLSQDLRALQKGTALSQRLELIFVAFGGKAEKLGPQIADAVIDEVLLGKHPLPRTEQAFKDILNRGTIRVRTAANEIERLIDETLREAEALEATIEKAPKLAAEDLRTQLTQLISAGFPSDADSGQVREYPRYLKAMRTRLDRLRNNPVKDHEKAKKVAPFQERYMKLVTHPKPPPYNEEALQTFRWMLEEFRVSLFAQELGTKRPVSEKRLEQQWKIVKEG